MTPARPEDALLAAGVPVLIPDTCALLDLVRVPIRETFTQSDGDAALALLALAEAGRITVAVPERVRTEFGENIEKVHGETANALEKIVDALEGMFVRLVSIGAAPLPPPPAIKTFSGNGRALADRLLARAVFFDGGDEERLNAANRMARAVRPALKGKDSFGDCLITECSLSLTRRLKAAGHEQPILFVSSNVADYCITRSKLAPPLDDEFQAADLAFACRWAAASWLARRDGGKPSGTAAHGSGGTT